MTGEGGGPGEIPDAAEATRSRELVGTSDGGSGEAEDGADEEPRGSGEDGTGGTAVADNAGDGFEAVDDPTPEALTEALRQHGLFRWLDLSIHAAEPGRVVFDLPFDEKFANLSSGTVHGGITATVIDTASGFALRSTFEDPARAALTTTDLNVRYIRPARDDLRVEAEVVRSGSSMGVTHCEVTTMHEGERKVVATGGTTYRLFRDAGAEGTDADGGED
ncbi:PaaI family thioesterase [Haloglomus litoreum]|uniref:PaaI family thioesterase n=1 Tax=Haloglomus litoreum TaxID=3034026 RepID=UPI0023E86BDC|nr:PaaI family thioesterase [Haloglomus sp. DT116]